MPANGARDARDHAAEARLDPDMDLGVAFNTLVDVLPRVQGRRDRRTRPATPIAICATAKAGVCRHRSFAFMITANALGIPTRLRRERGPRVRRGVVPRAQLAAHRSRRRRAPHGRHRRRQQDAAPAARRRSVREAARVQARTTRSSRATSTASPTQQIADKQKPLDQAPSSGSLGSGRPATAGARVGSGRSATRSCPTSTCRPWRWTTRRRTPSSRSRSRVPARGAAACCTSRRSCASTASRSRVIRSTSICRRPGCVARIPSRSGERRRPPTARSSRTSRSRARLSLATYEIWLSSSPDVYYNAALSD